MRDSVTEHINIAYHHPADRNRPGEVIDSISRLTFLRFSRYGDDLAKHPSINTFCIEPLLPEDYPHDDPTSENRDDKRAVRFVLDWMRSQSLAVDPDPLPHPVTFENTVLVHMAAYLLGAKKKLKRQRVRNALLNYLKMAPLTLEEFAMVIECLGFDGQLVIVALEATLTKFGQPPTRGGDYDRIEDYMLQHNIFCGMEECGIER